MIFSNIQILLDILSHTLRYINSYFETYYGTYYSILLSNSAILFNILCHNIEQTPSYFGLCSFMLWLSQRWNIWKRSVCAAQIGLVWSSPKQTGLPQMFHLPGPLYQYGPISHIMGNTQDILTYWANICKMFCQFMGQIFTVTAN